MTPIELLQNLKIVTEKSLSEMRLEVKGEPGTQEVTRRRPTVFLGKLPAKKEKLTKYIPYVLIRILSGADEQRQGNKSTAIASTRFIVATYSEDDSGYIDCLNIINRLRLNLLEAGIVGNKFLLKDQKIEWLMYEDDTGPYTIGEMVMEWDLPPIERKVQL